MPLTTAPELDDTELETSFSLEEGMKLFISNISKIRDCGFEVEVKMIDSNRSQRRLHIMYQDRIVFSQTINLQTFSISEVINHINSHPFISNTVKESLNKGFQTQEM